MFTGLGAAALHLGVSQYEILNLKSQINTADLNYLLENGKSILENNQNYSNEFMGKLNLLVNTPTVGASGAVFGILLAFGMVYPNTQILLLIPPMPIKAKYLVIGYGLLELYLGYGSPNSGVAHFAHVGGMVFGLIIFLYWKIKNIYY